MDKYRISKAKEGGFNLYRMKNMGNGWDKKFHSHYNAKEDAEQAMERLTQQKTLQNKGVRKP